MELKHVFKKCSSYKIYTLGSKLDSRKLMRIFFSTKKKKKEKKRTFFSVQIHWKSQKEIFNFLGHAERHT